MIKKILMWVGVLFVLWLIATYAPGVWDALLGVVRAVGALLEPGTPTP